MLKIYNKSNPLISILIANYNNGKLLKRAIKSCLKQNYKKVFSYLEELYQHGYDGTDIIAFLFKECAKMELDDMLKIKFLRYIGDAHMKILQGGTKIQMYSLLIQLIEHK